MQSSKPHGFTRLMRAARFSWQGLVAAYHHDTSFQEEVWGAAILIPLGLILGDNATERVLLVGSVLLVLIVELLNSAIESVVDRVSTERHELSGRAKDEGSAAVLVAIVIMMLTWGMLLF